MLDIADARGNAGEKSVFAEAMNMALQCRDHDRRLEMLGSYMRILFDGMIDLVFLDERDPNDDDRQFHDAKFGALELFFKMFEVLKVTVSTEATTRAGIASKRNIIKMFVWRDAVRLAKGGLDAAMDSLNRDYDRIREAVSRVN